VRSAGQHAAAIEHDDAVGVANHTYVSTRCGWFSDRTECYLAAGRPAIVQDTAWTAHLPSGEGLISFSTPDEAVDALGRVDAEYARHAARATDLAREYFEATRELSSLIERAARHGFASRRSAPSRRRCRRPARAPSSSSHGC
jgi:hypothetical protein